MGILLALAISVPAASCAPSAAQRRENEMIETCERDLMFGLKAPSSYKRVQVTVGIPDEKKHRQSVFIQYDAVNEYNAPLRQLKQCDFPYGPAEAKIRPVSDIERNVVAEVDREHPEIDDSPLDMPTPEPDCCMDRAPPVE